MRKTKVILWSVISVLLILLLITLFFLPQGGSGSSLFGSIYRYGNDAEGYTAGGGTLPSEGVDALVIDWMSGSVEILPSSDGLFHIEESTSRELKGEEEEVHTRIANGTLSVKFAKNNTNIFQLSKKLTVRVPKELSLSTVSANTVSASVSADGVNAVRGRIETVSGGVLIGNATFVTLSLNTVSGSCRAEQISADTLSIETVSGAVSLDGSADDITLDTVSGRIEATLKVRAPKTLRADSTSGDITLYLSEGVGFTASFSSVSGDFSSEIASTKRDDVYVAGDGGTKIRSETVSGDLKIRKK